MTPKLTGNFTSRRCEGNIVETVEQEEKLRDEVETLQETTYLGDRVSAGGGCEAAVTARTRFVWVKLGECGELLYGRRYSLKQKGAVNRSYVRPAIQNGSEAWHLYESEIGILRRTERSVMRVMCGVQHKIEKNLQI